MRMNKKENIRTKKAWTKRTGMRISLAGLSLLFTLTAGGSTSLAASYSEDYRFWSQGGSDYTGMREVGCLITAQAKMLYESNVIRDGSFNPDAWYNWLLANGGIASSKNLNMKNHNAPANYANSIGKNLEYLGYWRADDDQLWYNINAGYYTIVHVSGTNTGGSHYVLLDNELSKQTGTLYCYDSFSDRGYINQQLLSRYSIHNGGHVYKGYNSVHTHSYTEEIIAPALNEQGYTVHTCSGCGDSYKDSYVDALEDSSDRQIIVDKLAIGDSTDNCTDSFQDYSEEADTSADSAEITDSEYTAESDEITTVTNIEESCGTIKSIFNDLKEMFSGLKGNSVSEHTEESEDWSVSEDTADSEYISKSNEAIVSEDIVVSDDITDWKDSVDLEYTVDQENSAVSEDTMDWKDSTASEDTMDWEDSAASEDTMDWDVSTSSEHTSDLDDIIDSQDTADLDHIADSEDTEKSDWTITSILNSLKEMLIDLLSSILTNITGK